MTVATFHLNFPTFARGGADWFNLNVAICDQSHGIKNKCDGCKIRHVDMCNISDDNIQKNCFGMNLCYECSKARISDYKQRILRNPGNDNSKGIHNAILKKLNKILTCIEIVHLD